MLNCVLFLLHFVIFHKYDSSNKQIILIMSKKLKQDDPIVVYDFFSGCGGTSSGLRNAGMEIALGLDFDKYSYKTFKKNFPEAEFICEDINNIKTTDLEDYVGKPGSRTRKILFTGCAPCQPFSVLNRWKKSDLPTDDKQELERREKRDKEKIKKERLLLEFIRFIRYYLPDFIFVENVPGFQKISNEHAPFAELLKVLDELGYKYPKPKIIEMHKYGVPQRRRRIILIASLLGEIDYPEETNDGKDVRFATVFDKIGGINALPKIEQGETHPLIPNHQSAGLSSLNLQRIKAIPIGGNRLSLPENLQLECHKGKDATHTDVYSRLFWHEPATGLTTRCTSLSNGRFGHPEEDRAISAREAARLQTFSDKFIFEGGLNAVARQIGNAVPVLLAERFGENFISHFRNIELENIDG